MAVQGLTAIVTGAASGIGEATVRLLAADGANVVLADLNAEAVQAIADELTGDGAGVRACRLDVREPDQVQAVVDATMDAFGRVDILVNGAGICDVYAGIAETTIEQWDRIVDVNLRGTFLCCKAVIPAMRRHGGCIVNIASAAALYWPAKYPAYTAAKMGVLGLTQCMARELAGAGISVKAIRPVYVDTPMGREAFLQQEGREPTDADGHCMLTVDEVAGIIRTMVDPETACASSTIVDTMVVRN